MERFLELWLEEQSIRWQLFAEFWWLWLIVTGVACVGVLAFGGTTKRRF
jgi:hypothetical protein